MFSKRCGGYAVELIFAPEPEGANLLLLVLFWFEIRMNNFHYLGQIRNDFMRGKMNLTK